jgi:hypothetical protein
MKNVPFPFIGISGFDMWVPPEYKGKQAGTQIQTE